MNEYIKQWNEVIVNGSVDNTYKMILILEFLI